MSDSCAKGARAPGARDPIVFLCVLRSCDARQASIHEVPPRWLSHYGSGQAKVNDAEYAAMFTSHTLASLAEADGANVVPA